MKLSIFIGLLIIMSIFSSLALTASSQTSNVAIDYEGDSRIAINSRNQYVLTLTGGPADTGGTWEYTIIPIYENWTGAPKVEPKNASSESNVFFNFTAPGVAQLVKLKVLAESKNGTDSSTNERIIEIKVVKPIVISTTVYNSGDVSVEQAKVLFYANSNLISTKYVDLPANGNVTVHLNYTTYVEGKNSITIKIDPENEILKLAGGKTEITKVVYYREDAGKYEGLYILFIIVLIFMLLYVVNWTRKKVRGF